MFSIIIPCYNSAKTIARALDSLCVQSSLIKEVVIVDDGSQDDTQTIINSYQQRLPIRYFYQSNQGPSVARNVGIEHSTGQYVIFLDSDDALSPKILSVFNDQFLKTPEVGVIVAGHRVIHEHKIIERYPLFFQGNARNILPAFWRGDFSFSTDACVMRNDLLKQLRFPIAIQHGEDTVFFSHLFLNTTLITIQHIAVDVYYHSESLRHQNDSYFKERDLMIDLLFDPKIIPADLMIYQNKMRARRWLSLANKAAKAKQKDLAKEWLFKALKCDIHLLYRAKTLKTLLRLI